MFIGSQESTDTSETCSAELELSSACKKSLAWALALLNRPLNFYIGHFNVVYDYCITCITYSQESTWPRTCQKSMWSRTWTLILFMYNRYYTPCINFFSQESTWSRTWMFTWVTTWPNTHKTSTMPTSVCWVGATPCPPPSPVYRSGSTTPWPPPTSKVVGRS